MSTKITHTIFLVTGILNIKQLEGSFWKITFRGKKTVTQNREFRFYALDRKDAFDSIDPDELDFFKLEIDLTKHTFTPHEVITTEQDNTNSISGAR